jgi:hypothetical protein
MRRKTTMPPVKESMAELQNLTEGYKTSICLIMPQFLKMSKRHMQGGRRLLLYPLWTAIITLGSGYAPAAKNDRSTTDPTPEPAKLEQVGTGDEKPVSNCNVAVAPATRTAKDGREYRASITQPPRPNAAKPERPRRGIFARIFGRRV